MPFDMTTLPAFGWQAEIRPLYDAEGNEIPSNILRGVFRDDNDQFLSGCGPHTQLIQHDTVVSEIFEELEEQGYDLEAREADRHDLYDLQGKKGAFVSIGEAKHGGIMKTTITVGDFISPTGPSHYLPDGAPTLFRRYSVLNSHTTDYAAQVNMDYVCVQCMNGMVSVDFTATVKAKHTTGFSAEAFRKKVRLGASLMENDTERFKSYIKTRLTRETAEEYIKATIAKLAPKEGEPHWSKPLTADLLDRFHKNGGQTVWDLYMALTEWATHGDVRGGSSELTARIGRDERVARAMRTREFKTLLAA